MEEITSKISQETSRFASLFKNLGKSVEVIPWKGNEAVGLSVLKNYPTKGLFIPAKNELGEHDTVAVIKIGYYSEEIVDGKVPLIVRIHKASRFLLNNHWDFNFEDEESPSRESLEESRLSRQPIDLEETSRYELRLKNMKIYDKESRKYIPPSRVVKGTYDDHLRTLTDLVFRAKMDLQRRSIESLPKINEVLEKINYVLFGRKIRETKDFSTGIFSTYDHKDLVDLTTEKIKVFNSDFPITNQTARSYVFFFLAIYLVKKAFNYDFLGLCALFESTSNAFFLAILVSASLFVFDQVFPHTILFVQNSLIRLKLTILKKKIQI